MSFFGREAWQYIAIVLIGAIVFFAWTFPVGSIYPTVKLQSIVFIACSAIIFFWKNIFQQKYSKFTEIEWSDFSPYEEIFYSARAEIISNGFEPQFSEPAHVTINYIKRPPAFYIVWKPVGGTLPEYIAIGNALKNAPFRVIQFPVKYDWLARRFGFDAQKGEPSIVLPKIVEMVWAERQSTLDETLRDLRKFGFGTYANAISSQLAGE